MEIAAAIIAIVLLTVAALAISRAGADEHQEDLNDHDPAIAPGEARAEAGQTEQRTADRPAGPGAEAMGVRDAGATSTSPSTERG
jgi:hypothetical protein